MNQVNDIEKGDWDLIDEEEKLKTQIVYAFKEYDYLFILRKYSIYLKFGLDELDSVREIIHQGKGGGRDALLRIYTRVEYHYFSLFSVALSAENFLYAGLKDHLTEAAHKDFHEQVLNPWKQSEQVRLFKEIRNRIQHGNFFEGNFHYFFDLQAKDGQEKVSWSFEPDDHFWDSVYKKVDVPTKSYFDSKVKNHKYRLHFVVTEYQKLLSDLTDSISTKFDSMFPDASGRRKEMETKLQDVKNQLAQKGIYDPF